MAARSDALVLFGVTGDLAHKMIFPALYAMVKRGSLKVPVIGVALPKWRPARLHSRVKDSIKRSGGIDNERAFDRLLSLLKYVGGDYQEKKRHRVCADRRLSWGPKETDTIIDSGGGWHNPISNAASGR
jgi:glucose-6-phosphate 1-dehydrogenase